MRLSSTFLLSSICALLGCSSGESPQPSSPTQSIGTVPTIDAASMTPDAAPSFDVAVATPSTEAAAIISDAHADSADSGPVSVHPFPPMGSTLRGPRPAESR
jgi:hypothetical protein